MAKLVRIIEPSIYTWYEEFWELANNLELRSAFSSSDNTCEVFIFSQTGDVADQIYTILKSSEPFKDIELTGISSYSITLNKNLVKDLIKHVETINSKTLKHGKSY